MPTFLETVANDLMQKYNGDMSNIIIVFPNKRASLFMNIALTKASKKPMWSPRYITISELFRKHSKLQVADRIKLICDLHKVYCQVTQSKETLDEFYAWGELMLTDFDDVDKHRADASKVFAMLSDIHEFDGSDYLLPHQIELLKQFFENFSEDHNSELKQRFLNLWKKFHDIYSSYRSHLLSQGIAYEGMLYRDVIDSGIEIGEKDATYIFIGFNLLNDVEFELFSRLHKANQARFYWDFDDFYMHGADAGRYIRRYMEYLPNELPTDHAIYQNFRKAKDISYFASPTEDIQARYVSQWLTPERIAAGQRTAIVLCDESLLETILHCLPEEVKSVNITTGYPLSQVPVTTLIRNAVSLLLRKSYTLRVVTEVLQHPYMRFLSPKSTELADHLTDKHVFYPTLDDLSADDNLRQFFTPLSDAGNALELTRRLQWIVKTVAQGVNAEGNAKDNTEGNAKDNTEGNAKDNAEHIADTNSGISRASYALMSEALYRMYTLLNRMSQLLTEQSLQIEVSLLLKLINQIIQLTSIPFHGEPVEGIQIMGVLETRNLDFDHVLMLSCNEGKIPAKVNDSSFIPHSIRQAYGLTTVENKVSIYSYYFHRLLQRASDIQMLYNATASMGQSGEMSRFMLQLLAEGPWKNPDAIQRFTLEAGQESHSMKPDKIVKTQEMVDKLTAKEKFSPSELGHYLRCPLKFYFGKVMELDDHELHDPDDMDSADLGNIVHKTAELIYSPYRGRQVPRSYLENLLKEKGHITINRFIDQAFREVLFELKPDAKTPQLNGLQAINHDMTERFVCQLLEYDLKAKELEIIELEKRFDMPFEVHTCHGKKTYNIGGYIDRLDCITMPDGTRCIRVIDYKTGKAPGTSLKLESIEEIFNPVNIDKHSDYFLQAMLYSLVIADKEKNTKPIMPELLFLQAINNEKFSPYLSLDKTTIRDARNYRDEYLSHLRQLIEEILNPEVPFSPTEQTKRCDNCTFRDICFRVN